MSSCTERNERDRSALLPPLKSIRAFEAAARHLSFKLAAEELCVTPTAVSHQVRTLEDWLGVRLFHRLTRSLKLTSAGQIYAPFAIKGFQMLAEGSVALQSDAVKGRIVISTTMSFAGQWLGPRLPGLQELYPDLSVRVLSSDDVTNFARDGVDVAIRYGFGDYPGMHMAWVLDDYVAPVCSPDFPIDPRAPEALLTQPLINYEWSGFSGIDPSWTRWFRSAGIDGMPSNETVTYSDEYMCLQAAKDGHGVALVSLIAAARYLEAGELVAPFSFRMKSLSYFLVCPESAIVSSRIRAFQNWLLDEADVFRDSPVGMKFLEPEVHTAP